MKLLLLWNDEIHVGPLLRALPDLAALGIKVKSVCAGQPPAAIRDAATFDVLLVHQELMGPGVLDAGRPIVILERIDGAQLARSRQFIKEPQVRGVIKGYCLRPSHLNNSSSGRHHAGLLAAAGVEAKKSMAQAGPASLPVPNDKLDRILPGYGFGAYLCMDSFARTKVDFETKRPVDCHFFGTTTYSASEIETHRKAALHAVKAWNREHPGRGCSGNGRPLHKGAYVKSLLDTKTALSPYGWGEAAYRDYEAMFLGAVLVRPTMEYVACWPDVFRPHETYIPCAMDFSDVPEILERINADWPSFRPMRELARRLAIEGWRQQIIAPRMATLLKELLT